MSESHEPQSTTVRIVSVQHLLSDVGTWPCYLVDGVPMPPHVIRAIPLSVLDPLLCEGKVLGLPAGPWDHDRHLVLRVPGAAAGQPRARAATFAGRSRVYNPAGKHDDFKALVTLTARREMAARRLPPMTGPVLVRSVAFLPRPQRLARRKDPDGPTWATTKPDRDNADKAILDALTRAGIWTDDAQAASGGVEKLHVAKAGQPPETVIIIGQIGTAQP